MATKKKELLEQENSAPETTVPVENTPPPDEAQADMAAPSDGGDLNELLASMDQTDEDAAPTEDGGSLPELTESEMFGAAAADTAEEVDALPGEDDTAALTEGPDSDDGEAEDASAVPADDGAADVPGEPVSEEAEEPEPPKPKRATRRKKTAPAESTAPAEEIPAEAEPPEPMAPAGKMRRLMAVRRLRRKILPLWPNRRQRRPRALSHTQTRRRSPPQRARHFDYPQPGRCGDAGRP